MILGENLTGALSSLQVRETAGTETSPATSLGFLLSTDLVRQGRTDENDQKKL